MTERTFTIVLDLDQPAFASEPETVVAGILASMADSLLANGGIPPRSKKPRSSLIRLGGGLTGDVVGVCSLNDPVWREYDLHLLDLEEFDGDLRYKT